MKHQVSIMIILLFSSSFIYADTKVFGTIGGSSPVTEITSHSIKNMRNGVSIGVHSSTTVTGGSTTDGSGKIIPQNKIGAHSSSAYGVNITIPF